jgi:hypothetical protein
LRASSAAHIAGYERGSVLGTVSVVCQLKGGTVTAKHVAWFNFNEGVSDGRIEAHLEAVRSLVDLVPVVQQIECGPSYTDRAEGLTHCIIVTLPSREALPDYLGHPLHIPIADALVADVDELRVMDLDLSGVR